MRFINKVLESSALPPAVLGIAILLLLALGGCATPDERARTLLDRLEFEGDEYGTVEVTGNVKLSNIPFVGAEVHLKLEKFKDKPSQIQEVAP